MKKAKFGLLIAVAVIVCVLPLSAKAFMNKAEDSVYIPKEQTVSGSLFAAGSSITVDGKVQGDVFCAGQSIVINGIVDGDVFCAGQSVTINGSVGGSVRAAGNSIAINGKVSRNVMAAGANVTLSPEATVGWDMQFASAFSEIRGKVGRDVDGAGASATISGNVGRNVFLLMDDNRMNKENKEDVKASPIITSTATIGGNVSYRSRTEAQIEKGSMIKGETSRLAMKDVIDRRDAKNAAKGGLAVFSLIGLFSSLIIGLVFVSWLKRPAREITDIIVAKPWPSIGWGLIVAIVAPIAAFIVCIPIIGFALGLIILAAWLLAMYLGDIVFGVAFGRWLLKKFAPNKVESATLVWPMVLGIVVSSIIFMIPVIGWLACMVATLWGMGAIWQYGKAKS